MTFVSHGDNAMNRKVIFLATLFIIVLATFFFLSKPSEKNINNEIERANYCVTKDDCARVSGKCPFGCNVFVNKNEADKINSLINSVQSACEYKCAISNGASCIDKKCQAIY